MRRASPLLGAIAALLVLSACGVQTALMDTTPKADGFVTVASSASQAFYAPVDGLDGVSIGLLPETPQGETHARLAGGATYQLTYAPELDTSYPDGSFHDWPTTTQWLGELTGQEVIGQSFVSRYAGLDGITLRVATYGGDVGNGAGILQEGPGVGVRALPVDGDIITTVSGGSQVQVAGSAEGWARVTLPGGQTGFIALDQFAKLPPPSRINDQDVTLRLYREGESEPLRQATLNARDIHDNSHVTFLFDALDDQPGARYRFSLSSPGSHPGDAVTFRYAPDDIYPDGTRFQGGSATSGDLIFRPHYGAQPVLAQGKLDSFVWSAQTNTIDGRFAPIANTADRFVQLTIQAGDRPLTLAWSQTRPQGGQPLQVQGAGSQPQGGLVLNAVFRQPVHPGALGGSAAAALGRDARRDPIFFGALALLAVALAAGWLWTLWPSPRRGR